MPSRDRRTLFWLCMLTVGTLVSIGYGRQVRRTRAATQFASRTVERVGVTEACLLGQAGTRSVTHDSVSARTRALALGDAPTGWPENCAHTLDEAVYGPPRVATPEPEASAVKDAATALRTALSRSEGTHAMTAFREGRSAWHDPEWVAPLVRFHAAVEALGQRHALSIPATPAPRVSPRVLPALSGDVVPLPVHPGSQVVGWNFAAGTLSMEFIDPTRRRLLCRSRDRGVSIACHWLTPSGGGVAVTLVGHDRPEALVLLDRDGTAGVYSADALDADVYPFGAPHTRALAMRVAGDKLFAMVDTPAGAALERVARGGDRMAREPAGVATASEAVMLAPEPEAGIANGGAWWLASDVANDAPVLVARRLPAALDAPVGERVRVNAVHAPTALLYGCQFAGVGYVAVIDAPGGIVAAVTSQGPPRVLGALEQIDLPATLVCDGNGATVVGATWVQSCGRDAGCSPRWRAPGVRAFARDGGAVVEVLAASGGGLRLRRATPGDVGGAPWIPLADDAAHGGVNARTLWLFPAGDHLVLVGLGETHAVLWSADHGATWHPTRETGDAP